MQAYPMILQQMMGAGVTASPSMPHKNYNMKSMKHTDGL